MWEQRQIEENEEQAHPALGIFVVVKRVFRNLSEADLRNNRLVCRSWNFTAVSELVSRNYEPPPLKLCSSSSNQFRDRDYGWYLDFETNRRLLWTDLYGTECSILEFRHLHFSHPEKNEAFFKILELQWLPSVTSLTFSAYESSCETLLTKFFLPSFVNLRSLTCLVEPDFVFVDLVELLANSTLTSNSSSRSSGLTESNSTKQMDPEATEELNYSKIHSLTVCFEEACKFPWALLGSFPKLKDLELRFGDAAALINCSDDLVSGSPAVEIEKLQIKIIRKPNLNEQAQESAFHTELFATANSSICNHFLVQETLSVLSLIPASYTFVFLKMLKNFNVTRFGLDVAAPCNLDSEDRMREAFGRYLVPQISTRFPGLQYLQLQYLQQYKFDKIFSIVDLETLTDETDTLALEQLEISSTFLDCGIDEGGHLPVPVYGMNTILDSKFRKLTEVIFDVSCRMDCLAIIFNLQNHSVKKLVLRATSNFDNQNLAPWHLFPVLALIFPENWYYGISMTETYTGLPGISSLEELVLKGFALKYHPSVERQLRRTKLKSIRLDAKINQVNTIKENSHVIDYDHIWPCLLRGVTIQAI